MIERRIEDRIKKMVVVQDGFLEASKVFDRLGLRGKSVEEIDFTKGVLQAIGYKELFPFYSFLGQFEQGYLSNEQNYPQLKLCLESEGKELPQLC